MKGGPKRAKIGQEQIYPGRHGCCPVRDRRPETDGWERNPSGMNYLENKDEIFYRILSTRNPVRDENSTGRHKGKTGRHRNRPVRYLYYWKFYLWIEIISFWRFPSGIEVPPSGIEVTRATCICPDRFKRKRAENRPKSARPPSGITVAPSGIPTVRGTESIRFW